MGGALGLTDGRQSSGLVAENRPVATSSSGTDGLQTPPSVDSDMPGKASSGLLTASLPGSMRDVLRAISDTVSGQSLAGEFCCNVCMENCPSSEQVAFQSCPAKDKHAMCKGCASTYLRLRIDERRVEDIRCPLYGSDGCLSTVKDDQLEALVSPEVFQKYQRFIRMQEDPTLRECPVCGEMVAQPSRPTPSTPLQSAMTCSSAHQFCYFHSNAHPPGQEHCEAYTRMQVREARAVATANAAKECPHCGVLTQKIDGCNHMSCASCHKHWCWTCGVAFNGCNGMALQSCESLWVSAVF